MLDFLSNASSIKLSALTPPSISFCLKRVFSRYDFPQRLMPVIIFTFPFHLFCISRDMYSFRSITIFLTLDDSYCNFCRNCDCFCTAKIDIYIEIPKSYCNFCRNCDCFCSRTRKICILTYTIKSFQPKGDILVYDNPSS